MRRCCFRFRELPGAWRAVEEAKAGCGSPGDCEWAQRNGFAAASDAAELFVGGSMLAEGYVHHHDPARVNNNDADSPPSVAVSPATTGFVVRVTDSTRQDGDNRDRRRHHHHRNERLYRTGDVARWVLLHPGGGSPQLVVVGRALGFRKLEFSPPPPKWAGRHEAAANARETVPNLWSFSVSQVKIDGNRLHVSEIETCVLYCVSWDLFVCETAVSSYVFSLRRHLLQLEFA